MNSASLCSLAGRFDNPIPPRFLAPIDSLKIPAQDAMLENQWAGTESFLNNKTSQSVQLDAMLENISELAQSLS
jgi:hypothetical protein